jgi:hypothetical protein
LIYYYYLLAAAVAAAPYYCLDYSLQTFQLISTRYCC